MTYTKNPNFIVLKFLFSISLAITILIQSLGIGINDLAQIDEFIEHAQFHNEQYGDNLLVFISKHYGDLKEEHNQEHKEEKKEHEELPFQHQLPVSSVLASLLKTSNEAIENSNPFEIKKHNFYYLLSSSTPHSEEPFQPPRHS